MTKDGSGNVDTISYYLPHDGVLRQGSQTTKIRKVFDASTACRFTRLIYIKHSRAAAFYLAIRCLFELRVHIKTKRW
ncbi:hypothetical protein NQ318_007732 [Aromia moschata]|uniref:Uncharacterized protein n=1 Tax=Aromia moschata TaxID=1265417 RepID=A0AAV8Z257_9CUCU|nr:hypothetical protein NQ318_007732 [Aromia moschata]